MKKKTLIKIIIIITAINIINSQFCSRVRAASPTPKPTQILAPSPTETGQPSSPSATPVDEKVNEIRQAIKDKLNQIKEKIEKKAYVGGIIEITDSTIVLSNFRGKQRVRINEETIIVDANRKEIKNKDLAVDDKIITMGILGENEILEAKRIVVVPPPKIPPAKKLVVLGTITKIDNKNQIVTITPSTQETTKEIKIDNKNTRILAVTDQKTELKFKILKENQKILVVYLETAPDKTPIAKTTFLVQ